MNISFEVATLPLSFGRVCPHASLYPSRVPQVYTPLQWPQGCHPTLDTNVANSGGSLNLTSTPGQDHKMKQRPRK